MKKDQFSVKELNTPPNRSLAEALNAFYQSVVYNSEPPVGISESCQAQQIAHMISDKIEMSAIAALKFAVSEKPIPKSKSQGRLAFFFSQYFPTFEIDYNKA